MSSDSQPNELFNAAKNQKSILTEAILKEDGLNPNEKDNHGYTPLFYAAGVGSKRGIGYSLSEDAIDTIRVLIENGANADIANHSGETVLEIARTLITAADEYSAWLELAELLYGKNTTLCKERIATVEKEFDANNPTKYKIQIPETEFPTFPEKKNTQKTKENLATKESDDGGSKIVASTMGFAFFLSPVLTLYFTWSDLFGLSSDWLWIDNSIVGVTFFIASLVTFQIIRERNYLRYILFFLPSVFACILYFGIVISFFQPEIRFQVKKHFYMQGAFQSTPVNYWVQKGFYEDFFKEISGEKLRSDEELLIRLTEGLRPNTQRAEIGQGFGAEDYVKQGLTIYISYREMNLSPEDIFHRPEAIWLFYALALAESNPDLVQISNIPEEFSKKYMALEKNAKYPLGILDDSKMNQFYEQVVKNIGNASEIETELAIFLLTQIPVSLEETQFNAILNHWGSYKKFYTKELKYLTALRNGIRQIFLREAKINKPIGVSLGYSSKSTDWEVVKPFLISTGFSVEQGNDINLSFTSEVEFLKDKKVNRTKAVRKTRTASRNVRQYGNRSSSSYRTESYTETYTDYVSDGFDIIPMYSYSYAFPKIVMTEDNVRLCGMLADCYLNNEKETTLPPEAYARGETWIYALPKKLVCKSGCDGR